MDVKEIEKKAQEGAELTAEEQQAILEDEGAVDGYQRIGAESEEEDYEKEGDAEGEGSTEDADSGSEEAEQAKSEEAKQKETKPEQSEQDDVFLKLETELAKPEGKEDLTRFTPREKAYFHQMRRDRKNRQKAEAERDAALFREKKSEIEKKAARLPKDVIDELKSKNPGEYVKVEDVLQLIESEDKKAEAQPESQTQEPPAQEPKAQDQEGQHRKFLEMCDNEARNQHPDDYDAVMELTPEIINTNPEYLKQVQQEIIAGKNPAIKAYELIKNDPEFENLYPAAEVRWKASQAAKAAEQGSESAQSPATTQPQKASQEKSQPKKTPEQLAKEAEAAAAQRALEKNTQHKKTTGSVDSSDSDAEGELTLDDAYRMSDLEFAQQPKKWRDKMLKRMFDV